MHPFVYKSEINYKVTRHILNYIIFSLFSTFFLSRFTENASFLLLSSLRFHGSTAPPEDDPLPLFSLRIVFLFAISSKKNTNPSSICARPDNGDAAIAPLRVRRAKLVVTGEVMRLHHQKHHQTYVTNYNTAFELLDRPWRREMHQLS